jgi:hypothetical protein
LRDSLNATGLTVIDASEIKDSSVIPSSRAAHPEQPDFLSLSLSLSLSKPFMENERALALRNNGSRIKEIHHLHTSFQRVCAGKSSFFYGNSEISISFKNTNWTEFNHERVDKFCNFVP